MSAGISSPAVAGSFTLHGPGMRSDGLGVNWRIAVDSKAPPARAQAESETCAWSRARAAEIAPQRPSFWIKHRFSLAGLAVGAAIIGLGAFVVYDLRRTHAQVRQRYAGSARAVDRGGGMPQ